MNKTVKYLFVLLLLQVLLFGGIFICQTHDGSDQQNIYKLFTLSMDTINKIEFASQQEKIVLEKQDGSWVLPEYESYNGDKNKIQSLLSKIVSLTSTYIISEQPSYFNDLEVAADRFKKKIVLYAFDQKHELFIGKTASGFTSLRYQDTVYGVDGINEWEIGTKFSDWAQRAYYHGDRSHLSEFTIQKKNQRFTFVRTRVDDWKVNGRTAVNEKIEALLDQLLAIEINGVVGEQEELPVTSKTWQVELLFSKNPLPGTVAPTSDMDSNSDSINEVDFKNGLFIQLDPQDEKQVRVKATTSKFVVTTDTWRFEKLINVTLRDFIK